MNQKEIQNFIYFMNHNKRLSHQQQLRRDRLMVRDYANKGLETDSITTPKKWHPLKAKDTALFLSWFNDPMKFKYLTHDYDPEEDGRPHNIEELRKQVTDILHHNTLEIPKSLKDLMAGFTTGTYWLDYTGEKHFSSWSDPKWTQWEKTFEKPCHPRNNPIFRKEIDLFRSTSRLVAPELEEMINDLKPKYNLEIETEGLQKGDFRTNTLTLLNSIKRILKMMEDQANRMANKKNGTDSLRKVKISYKREYSEDNVMLRTITITQYGSYPSKELEADIDKLKTGTEPGDMGSIRKMLNGYCNWSVISKWAGNSYRWNIINDMGKPEKEPLDETQVVGFTHVLTYYFL